MIKELIRLSALYLVVYIYVRQTSGKEFAWAIKWLAMVSLGLMVLSCIAIPLKQFSDDVHSIALTYSAGSEKVNNILGNKTNKDVGDINVGYKDIWERFLGAKFDWPIRGKITQGFNENNHGLDLAGNLGQDIKASRTGKVEKIGIIGVYGLVVIINHGNGYQTLYAHCSKVVVKENDMVLAGQKIAEVGGVPGDPNSGDSTGTHLHFSIIVNGQYVNPLDYMK